MRIPMIILYFSVINAPVAVSAHEKMNVRSGNKARIVPDNFEGNVENIFERMYSSIVDQ